jgi:outer membrane PBP1 activator LpoA protein
MLHSEDKTHAPLRITRLLSGVLLALTITACATVPIPPSEALLSAELAISSAEQERATDFAPQYMKQAHDKLGAARVAVVDEDMDLALLLANESRVSAELASARASELKAKAVNDEMQQSIDALQQEIMRNTGSRP